MPHPKTTSRSGSDRIRNSFERKLAIMQKLANAKKARLPLRDWYPLTLREFRDWQVPGEFDSWVSQSIDAPNGRYPELAKRLADLLRLLKSDPLEEENSRLRAENSQLMQQNVQLEIAVRALRDELVLKGASSDDCNVIALYRATPRP